MRWKMSDDSKYIDLDDYIAELEAINAELEKASSYSLLKQNEKLKEWKKEATRLLRQVPPDRQWLSDFWIRDVKELLEENGDG